MPLGADQGLGALVWSPLGWGRLTGKIRSGTPLPAESRLHETAQFGPPVDEERLYRVIDVLDELANETDKSVPQIALNWLIQRPTVSSIIVGARTEAQLRQNLGGRRLDAGAQPDRAARRGERRHAALPPIFPIGSRRASRDAIRQSRDRECITERTEISGVCVAMAQGVAPWRAIGRVAGRVRRRWELRLHL